MNILNHDVLTEKLQKKPNKSYIQKVQQFEGNKTMTLKKFKATGRKMKTDVYLKNYFKHDISLIDMGSMVEKDAEYVLRYVGGMLIQVIGKNFYTRYYNNFNTFSSKGSAEQFLYTMISEHIVSGYCMYTENQ
tara:strand:+ start:360 stop:758 length:399 start_codon:yes stop_codon:yes gene_type:complete